MLSYETLDTIADTYIPILLIIATVTVFNLCTKRQWKTGLIRLATLLLGASLVYGFMFVDKYFEIWPRFNLDYSTHTSASLVLVILLSHWIKKYLMVWLGSFLLYALLMLYQQYHTTLDILTTAVVIGGLAIGGLMGIPVIVGTVTHTDRK